MDINAMNNSKPAMLKWNWGAFMMPLQFGIGNKAYLCLLTLVPFLNFVWMFVAGFKGAEWAYNSGEFATEAEFNASMRTWNRAGFVYFLIGAIAIALYCMFFASIIGTFIAAFD